MKHIRDVVQPGRALAWGARCRRFESSRPDQIQQDPALAAGFCCIRIWETGFEPPTKEVRLPAKAIRGYRGQPAADERQCNSSKAQSNPLVPTIKYRKINNLRLQIKKTFWHT